MASLPPGQCCMTGVKHEGTAVGEIKKIGVRTYFSYPPNRSTEKAILYLPDALGMDSINAHLIADALATAGYLVLIPDLFHNDPLPLNPDGGYDLAPWLKRHPISSVDPVVRAVLKEMRGKLGCRWVGGVGYCFGGKYVVRFLGGQKEGHSGKNGGEVGLDAGFIAHPSFVEEGELAGVRGALSIAAAETDPIFTAALRHKSEDILANIEPKIPWQITLYSGVQHGFAVRGDMGNRVERVAMEMAFTQMVGWFGEFLGGV